MFEEIRRHVEGRLWESIEAKMEAAERFLQELSKDAERVRRLAGWQWIVQSIANLPRGDHEFMAQK